MPTMTIEALRENPWNVISQGLPPNPPRVLLRLALMAADYCRRSEGMLIRSAREGEYVPAWWRPGEVQPDVHEESEECLHRANCRFEEIAERFASEYCELTEDDPP